VDQQRIKQMEAMIQSMTPQERAHPEIIGGSRRRRIARGSGTGVQEVNQLLAQFKQMKQMLGQVAEMERKSRRGTWPTFPR
jgi:signal recognition particle subunit SRP54